MQHEGVFRAKALATLEALKLKLSTALLVVLNMVLITVHDHEVYLQIFLVAEALATLETIVDQPLLTLKFHLDSWLIIIFFLIK